MSKPKNYRAVLKSLANALAVRHAIAREQRIGPDERMTAPRDQYAVAELLLSIRVQWRLERKEAGL